jgi:hypothetical protein
MSDLSILAKINTIYLAYAKTTLPKGKGWFAFASIALGLLFFVPTILHRVFLLPLFPNEVDIVHLVPPVLLMIFVIGILFQWRNKPKAAQPNVGTGKYDLYQPIIRSLAEFPAKELRLFLDLQKEEWAEADKEAETSAPTLIALATLVTTLANWGSQPKAQFVLVLLLITLVFIAIAYSRKRLVQLRRFEFFTLQALIQNQESK